MENTLLTQFGALGKVCNTKTQHKISYDLDTCNKNFANNVNHEKQQHQCNQLSSIYETCCD